MATILEKLDELSFLANNPTWWLFRRKIEQRETQRKLILVSVCVALLLDNMLYMVIVPIIPDYLRQIGAWDIHKEGRKIEYKQMANLKMERSTVSSLIHEIDKLVNQTNNLSDLNDEITKTIENQEEADYKHYSKKNKNDKEINIKARSSDNELNSQKKLNGQESINFKNKTHASLIENDSHTVYEGEDSAIGILFASKAIVQLIVNPFSGAIIDRLGYDRPMIFGLIVLFLSTTMFAVGCSYEVLFVARSLQGIGSAFADTSGFAMIADRFTEPDQREKALGIALSFVSFGCLTAPPFGSLLYEFFGKQLPFIVLSLICLLDGFLVILIMIPAVKEKQSKNRRSSSNFMTIKTNYQSSVNGHYRLSHELINESPQATPIYVLLRDRFIAVCAGALMMANVSLACLEPTISIWMQDTMEDIESWKLGMIWLPSFFPYVFGVYLTVNCNRKYPNVQYLIAISGLALTGLSCLFIPFATNYYQLFLPIAVLCFGVAVIDTSIFPLLAFIVDTRYVSVYGSVYAIADISYSIAYASGPVIAGNIMAAFGFTFLNIFIAILVAAYCPVLMSLKRINEYNVIGSASDLNKSGSLGDNLIDDSNIDLCVNPNLIKNFRINHNELSDNFNDASFFE